MATPGAGLLTAGYLRQTPDGCTPGAVLSVAELMRCRSHRKSVAWGGLRAGSEGTEPVETTNEPVETTNGETSYG